MNMKISATRAGLLSSTLVSLLPNKKTGCLNMSEVAAEYFDYLASETEHVFQFDQHAVKYGFGSRRLAVLTCRIEACPIA